MAKDSMLDRKQFASISSVSCSSIASVQSSLQPYAPKIKLLYPRWIWRVYCIRENAEYKSPMQITISTAVAHSYRSTSEDALRRGPHHSPYTYVCLGQSSIFPSPIIPPGRRGSGRRPRPRPTPSPVPSFLPTIHRSIVLQTSPPVLPAPPPRSIPSTTIPPSPAGPTKHRISHIIVLVVREIHFDQPEIIVQHVGVLQTTPPPIFVNALCVHLLCLLDLDLELLELRSVEGRVTAVALVEVVAGQALDVLCVVLEARGAELFEVAADLAFGVVDDPVSASVVVSAGT